MHSPIFPCQLIAANFFMAVFHFFCDKPLLKKFIRKYGDQDGACQTPVVFGCMDTLACNYDPQANFQIDNLCCYPGFCQERDLEEVCPQLKGESFDFKIFPNPVTDQTFIQVISGVTSDLEILVTDYNGLVIYSDRIVQAPLNYSTQLDFSDKPSGIYLVRVTGVEGVKNGMLVKL
jgi:hypothetical protein